jgi:hypothetical protein
MLVYQRVIGGFNHLEKYESMGRIIPHIMENKKCSKPPTRRLRCGLENLRQGFGFK